MSSRCPVAPGHHKSNLSLQLTTVAAGTRLVRFHGGTWPAHSFNPNTGKRIDVPTDGARFNPFPGTGGINVPTLYAADDVERAALESVFHDVPHIPSPAFARSQLTAWRYNRIEVLRDLSVLELDNPHLRQLKVRGRKPSLNESELIHTPPVQYPRTRTWARFLHDSLPNLDGLAWRPRLGGGTKWAYVFFGDRCNGTLREQLPAVLVDSGDGLAEIERIAAKASIRLV